MEAKLHGKLWFDVLKILVGSSLVAISFRYLTFPNSIVSGGVTGIAQIVNLLTGLPVGAVTVVINVPLFLWAWQKLGKRFVALTLLCMLTTSLLIDLFAHIPYTVTEEPMLAAVYGVLSPARATVSATRPARRPAVRTSLRGCSGADTRTSI